MNLGLRSRSVTWNSRYKQEQLHGGALRFEANLPVTSTVIAQYLLQMHNRKCWPRKFRSTWCNITSAWALIPFDGSINVNKSHNMHFCASSHRFRATNISDFLLSDSGQGIRWQHFTLALAVSEILRFGIFDLENWHQGHGVQHSMVPCDDEYQRL